MEAGPRSRHLPSREALIRALVEDEPAAIGAGTAAAIAAARGGVCVCTFYAAAGVVEAARARRARQSGRAAP